MMEMEEHGTGTWPASSPPHTLPHPTHTHTIVMTGQYDVASSGSRLAGQGLRAPSLALVPGSNRGLRTLRTYAITGQQYASIVSILLLHRHATWTYIISTCRYSDNSIDTAICKQCLTLEQGPH